MSKFNFALEKELHKLGVDFLDQRTGKRIRMKRL